MTRMLPYLPIFIALATSSPFWQSRRTGLLGYRLAAELTNWLGVQSYVLVLLIMVFPTMKRMVLP